MRKIQNNIRIDEDLLIHLFFYLLFHLFFPILISLKSLINLYLLIPLIAFLFSFSSNAIDTTFSQQFQNNTELADFYQFSSQSTTYITLLFTIHNLTSRHCCENVVSIVLLFPNLTNTKSSSTLLLLLYCFVFFSSIHTSQTLFFTFYFSHMSSFFLPNLMVPFFFFSLFICSLIHKTFFFMSDYLVVKDYK